MGSLETYTDQKDGAPAAPVLPAALRKSLDERIAAGALELPILLEAAALLLSMSNDDDFDPQKLENIVQKDAALAAHLLRIANSALFASRVPITSLRKAISRLGIYELRHVALLFSCETRVFRVRGWETEVRALFEHSLATGLFAQQIAKLTRMNTEDAFLAGLLHDIGHPVLLQTLVDLQGELRCSAPRPAVRRAVSDRHATVGAELARSWALPPRLVEIIGVHHAPRTGGEGERHAALVHLADDLARRLFGDNLEEGQPPLDESALEILKLPEGGLEALLAKGREVELATRALS